MTKVTVNKPEQAQVQVSSDRVQSVFTSVDPELRINTANNSLSNVILEGNTSVDVQGSLASIANYFKSLNADLDVPLTQELFDELDLDFADFFTED